MIVSPSYTRPRIAFFALRYSVSFVYRDGEERMKEPVKWIFEIINPFLVMIRRCDCNVLPQFVSSFQLYSIFHQFHSMLYAAPSSNQIVTSPSTEHLYIFTKSITPHTYILLLFFLSAERTYTHIAFVASKKESMRTLIGPLARYK